MSDRYIGQISLFSFQFAPKSFAQCNGQLLPIAQNQALFALLGTNYGGNGQTTFALPNLRGRVAIGMGQGPGLSPRNIGETSGEAAHTLTQQEMPEHSHSAHFASDSSQMSAKGHYWAGDPVGNVTFASSTDGTSLNGGAIANAGGSQPHENRQPFLVLNFCIALQGVFPSFS
jgi:microcystin-dependent protein